MSNENPQAVGAPLERHVGRRGRTIVVAGKTWQWRLGLANVVAYGDCGQKRFAPAHEVKGVSSDTWQRGRWKRTSDGRLTPADVARWLSTPNDQHKRGASGDSA